MPIRPIDRFVSALHRQHGDELMLETGTPVRLRVGREERVILAQDVRNDQIELLLRDVLPDDIARSFRGDGEVAFPYQAPTGPVLLRIKRSGERVAVCVSHYVAPARASEPRRGAYDAVERTIPPIAPQMSGPIREVMPSRVPTGVTTHSTPPARGRASSSSGAMPYSTSVSSTGAHERMSRSVEPIELPPEPVITAPARGPNVERERSGDTGPIELDMGTGNIPFEVMQLSSADIVAGPERGAQPDVRSRFDDPAPAPSYTLEEPAPRAYAPPAAQASTSAPQPAASLQPAYAPPPRITPSPQPGGPRIKAKIDPLLHALVESKGSDLHLTAGLQPRMRKDGDMGLLPGFEDALESQTIETWMLEIAPPKSRAKFEQTNDADFGYEVPNVARFRVNVFRDRRGCGGVIRVIPAKVLTADQLNLPQAVRDLTTLKKGLVLVTGPTGSGKSTTLAAMIDLANKQRADHILTIEDPVEFVHVPQKCLINQREVHTDTESFSSGLRAALREDPDIILVGEMRDLETIAIAVETAETGHLVFGTLHTTTAISTVDRIVDQFPADRQQQIRIMLSSALKGVVAQTLCRKIGGGRVAALEILLVVPAVSNLIREAKTFQIASILQTSKALGMQTLNDALFKLVEDKVIAADEALRCAVARTELRAALEKANLAPK